MKNIYQLIDLCRKQTENEEYSFNTGIQDEEFIEYLNDAQNNIQASIVKQHPKVFIEEAVLNVVSGQEKYDIPSDCFLGNKIFNIEYSPTGNDDDYYVLSEDIMKYRSTGVDGSPTKYIRISGKILLTPVPATGGKLRINYVKALPEIAKPLGEIHNVYSNTSTGNTSIYLINSTQMPIIFDGDTSSSQIAYSIVSKKGEVAEKNIDKIISADSQSISVQTDRDFEKYHRANYFLMPGENSTCIPQVDRTILRYLISYCNWKILKRDSSVDSSEAMQELQLMSQEIVSSYANISDDIQLIPQLNAWDDWSV